jgi:hypothetical protein
VDFCGLEDRQTLFGLIHIVQVAMGVKKRMIHGVRCPQLTADSICHDNLVLVALSKSNLH